MKVYVETNPETIYSGRVKDEVKTTEIRMWFETDEEIEVLSLADYAKQVRAESEADKKVLICDYESRITKHQELMSWLEHNNDELKQQLHDLPNKIVGEIKKELYDCGKTYLEDEPYIEICIVQGILDTILKKYGGKENGKSNM